jgi:large subunit ribosomal protein L7/L12
MTKEEIIQAIEGMTVKELAELVKALEERFGVSAQVAAPVAVATAPQPAAAGATAAPEKTTFDVVITNAGQQKIQLIKVVKDITGKGLKECKDLVDNVPAVVKSGVSKEEAEELKKKLEAAGAEVQLK